MLGTLRTPACSGTVYYRIVEHCFIL